MELLLFWSSIGAALVKGVLSLFKSNHITIQKTSGFKECNTTGFCFGGLLVLKK
jgi:hypothetical protein